MDTWIHLSQGFAVAMTPENLLIALIGCFVGTIVGLPPGLGPINGVAILLPLALPCTACGIGADSVGDGLYRLRIWRAHFVYPAERARRCRRHHDGALDGYPMAQQGAAASRCRFPPSALRFAYRDRRHYSVRAGASPSGRWRSARRNISR